MAYGNMFPAGYGQQYYPQYPQMQQQIQQPQQIPQGQQMQSGASSLTWVQGLAGAKSYLVAPNSTVQLWDSEAPRIYLKSADASGMPSMRILSYKEIKSENGADNDVTDGVKSDYVTRTELDEIINQKFEQLKGDLGA